MSLSSLYTRNQFTSAFSQFLKSVTILSQLLPSSNEPCSESIAVFGNHIDFFIAYLLSEILFISSHRGFKFCWERGLLTSTFARKHGTLVPDEFVMVSWIVPSMNIPKCWYLLNHAITSRKSQGCPRISINTSFETNVAPNDW